MCLWLKCVEILSILLFCGVVKLLVRQALFPFKDWWVVPAKVAFDQTVWSAVWNSIYYVVLGFLRGESLEKIVIELKATFVPLLTVRTLMSLNGVD